MDCGFAYEDTPEAVTEVLPPNDTSEGYPIVVVTKFNSMKALHYLQQHKHRDAWEVNFDKQLKEFEFTRLEFPRTNAGYLCLYIRVEGTYKSQKFRMFIDYRWSRGNEIYEGPQELKKEIVNFFWSGSYLIQLFWT